LLIKIKAIKEAKKIRIASGLILFLILVYFNLKQIKKQKISPELLENE
jgi:hypothetical protein